LANLKGSHYVELRCSARLLASLIYCMEFQSFPHLSPPPLRGRIEVRGLIYNVYL